MYRYKGSSVFYWIDKQMFRNEKTGNKIKLQYSVSTQLKKNSFNQNEKKKKILLYKIKYIFNFNSR